MPPQPTVGSVDTVIVGGGLSGLVAANHLARAHRPFVLLEARDQLGGRIRSDPLDSQTGTPRLDLGPSWFWPDNQPNIDRLVADFGLQRFRQHDVGDLLLEHGRGRVHRQASGPAAISYRIAGGIGALVAALAATLPPGCVRPGVQVTKLTLHPNAIRLDARSVDGEPLQIDAARAILALPPRLAEAIIEFDPPLPPPTRTLWRATPTWMAPHAKFVAIYTEAFWRTAGLSGDAQSMIGPMGEIHDATTADGIPALFGFLGIPAADRARLGPALRQACIDQLTNLFGPAAAHPTATLFKDWATDPFTATEADLQGAPGHPTPARRRWVDGDWTARLAMAGSETATAHPGYLEGAIVAATAAVK